MEEWKFETCEVLTKFSMLFYFQYLRQAVVSEKLEVWRFQV